MPAASSRWLGIDERPPHEQGAGALRFVPLGAVMGVDGGRPTSRGLSPAALGDEGRERTAFLRGCVAKYRGSGGIVVFVEVSCVRHPAAGFPFSLEERGLRRRTLQDAGLRHGCGHCSRAPASNAEGKVGGNDASLPRGARICCRCAGSTLFAPAGQKRFRVGAPDFGVSRGKAGRWGALPIRNGWQARQKDEAYPFALHEAAESAQPSCWGNGGLCPHPLKGSIP